MTTRITLGRWDLAKDRTARLPRSRSGIVVRAERGTVLVTRSGDLDDHVLDPGQELRLPAEGLAVAWAFEDAVLDVRDAAVVDASARAASNDERALSAPLRATA